MAISSGSGSETRNFKFYNMDGYPFEFDLVTDDENVTFPYYTTSVLIQPISVSLFDCKNIFILEEIDDVDENGNPIKDYYFPQLSGNENLYAVWNDTNDNESSEFFLFDVLNDENTKLPYISRKSSDLLQERDVLFRVPGNRYAGKQPYQINCAFSPKEEQIYERFLNVYYRDGDTILQCWQFHFYGEGIEEDERFKIHLENFGIKFNRTDALCLKDYDITEALPDWDEVNRARKSIFINKEEVFPYVGTYYGLKNILMILGYSDELDVKEYWKDISDDSMYNGKYVITSITDMLDDGIIQNKNLVDNNASVKNSDQYQKTGFLALCYEFTRPTGEYDENECPILERTTKFTSGEIFYKLRGLKKLLHSDYLPVNVHIKDLIGEFAYYISFSKLVWMDKTTVERLNLNELVTISVFPDPAKTYIRNLYRFGKYESESPVFNDPNSFETTEDEKIPINSIPEKILDSMPTSTEDEKEKKKRWESDEVTIPLPKDTNKFNESLNDDSIEYLADAIFEFYKPTNNKNAREIYNDVNSPNDDFGDLLNEPLTKDMVKMFQSNQTIGCPVVLTANIQELTFMDMYNTAVSDFFNYISDVPSDSDDWDEKEKKYKLYVNSSLERLKYKDYYEIEWYVKYVGYPYDEGEGWRPESFEFRHRTTIDKGVSMPVFLPYEGYYDVCLMLYSLTGNVTKKYDNRRIEVKTFIPDIVACYTGDDKFNFTFEDLNNVTVNDLGNSTPNNPFVNVLFMNDKNNINADVPTELYDSSVISAFERDIEVFNEDNKEWENIYSSNYKYAEKLRFGDGDVLRLNDFKTATVNDLFHLRTTDCVLSRDTVPGFMIDVDKKDLSDCYLRLGVGSYETDIITKKGYLEIKIPKYKSIKDLCNKLNNLSDDDAVVILRNFEFNPTYCMDSIIHDDDKDNDPIDYEEIYDKKGNFKKINAILVSGKNGNNDEFTFYEILDVNHENVIQKGYTFPAPKHGFPYETSPIEMTDTKSKYYIDPLYSLNIDAWDIYSGAAKDFSYFVKNDYFRYEDVYDEKYKTYCDNNIELKYGFVYNEKNNSYLIDENNFNGNLPVILHNNYINLDTKKFSRGSFVIPKYKYVIFFVHNLHRQVTFEWTLLDSTGKKIVMTRNSPYFVWRFDESGIFNISYHSFDALGNEYTNNRFGMITVLESNEYINFVEGELNKRLKNK